MTVDMSDSSDNSSDNNSDSENERYLLKIANLILHSTTVLTRVEKAPSTDQRVTHNQIQ